MIPKIPAAPIKQLNIELEVYINRTKLKLTPVNTAYKTNTPSNAPNERRLIPALISKTKPRGASIATQPNNPILPVSGLIR
ncbi:hypothetical protein D3C87_2024630 [compost metagenome]